MLGFARDRSPASELMWAGNFLLLCPVSAAMSREHLAARIFGFNLGRTRECWHCYFGLGTSDSGVSPRITPSPRPVGFLPETGTSRRFRLGTAALSPPRFRCFEIFLPRFVTARSSDVDHSPTDTSSRTESFEPQPGNAGRPMLNAISASDV